MGIISRGILGGFRKKTGTVVGARWRGLYTIRAVPEKTETEPTQEQLDQRFKFGLITSLLSWISAVVDIGYRSAVKVPTPMNEAVSYNLRNAVTGVSPTFSLDPVKLRFSKGKLSVPTSVGAVSAIGSIINLTWSNDLAGEQTHALDAVHIVVYNPDKARFVSVLNAATRADEAYSVQVPLTWEQDVVHCYLCLSAPKQISKACSDTAYVAQVTVL